MAFVDHHHSFAGDPVHVVRQKGITVLLEDKIRTCVGKSGGTAQTQNKQSDDSTVSHERLLSERGDFGSELARSLSPRTASQQDPILPFTRFLAGPGARKRRPTSERPGHVAARDPALGQRQKRESDQRTKDVFCR